ncbi:3-carboxy-cis,cis-muconate cycloisomerase [Nocardioides sp. ChNu-153]|uniref:lyase family protein n=1 Tax=unclassified Nocardioides TaxID=2615069 RepID=UPI00240707C7|nr:MULTISPECIES: lyase family protein [unclassified Nocardioides]MDN7121830.1 3-carboxy-cis,cis-muconate cycloisomerase [Nocardioides sp. ChNu-153]
MSDLFWPGDERAGALFTDAALLEGMVAMEAAWSAALAARGLAPAAAVVSADDLLDGLTPDDMAGVVVAAEAGGDPVVPLVAMLRNRLVVAGRDEAAHWLHQGLSGQDVVDTALMICAGTTLRRLEIELGVQVTAITALAGAHRGTLMVGRTVTQHAVPTTFGARAAGWLAGVKDARASVAFAHSILPAQVGGTAGTLAATVELARLRGVRDPVDVASKVAADAAATLGLQPSPPWFTSRFPVTRVGDALATTCSAMGHVAADVVTLTRPEVAEVSEPVAPGRGDSSTTPHQQVPVLATLVRRAAITAPGLAATLHTAAGLANDERSDGAWHAEWATLRDLARRTVVAASHLSELVSGLRVDVVTMGERVRAAEGVLRERDAVRVLLEGGDGSPASVPEEATGGGDPASYLGIIDPVVDQRIKP